MNLEFAIFHRVRQVTCRKTSDHSILEGSPTVQVFPYCRQKRSGVMLLKLKCGRTELKCRLHSSITTRASAQHRNHSIDIHSSRIAVNTLIQAVLPWLARLVKRQIQRVHSRPFELRLRDEFRSAARAQDQRGSTIADQLGQHLNHPALPDTFATSVPKHSRVYYNFHRPITPT